MLSHGILEIIFGLVIISGIIWKEGIKRTGDLVKALPYALIAVYLIFQGLIFSLDSAMIIYADRAHFGISLLIFLPFACFIAEKKAHEKKLTLNIWITIGLTLLIYHAISSSHEHFQNIQGFISDFTITVFLALSVAHFRGIHKSLLILAALTWAIHFTDQADVYSSGLGLLLGSLTLFQAGFLTHPQAFGDFDFDSKDLIDAFRHPFIVLDLSGGVVFANDEFMEISGHNKEKLKGIDAVSLFELPGNWRLKMNPRESLRKIRCHLKAKDGSKLPVSISSNEIRKNGKVLKNILCLIDDEFERETMENKIKSEARRFAGLYETSRALSSSLERKDVLEAIATAAETLTDSNSCTIFALDHAAQIIRPIYSTEEVYNAEVMNFEFPVGQGLTGKVVQDGMPRIQNFDDEDEIAVLIPGTVDEEESLLSVPLLAKNVVIGGLTLYRLGKKRFVEEHIKTLIVFASQASAAIETSRLYMKLKDSENVYRSSMDMASDAIFFADPATGKITDVNDTAGRIFGYSRSEFVSKFIWEMHPQPQMHSVRKFWQMVVTDRQGKLSEISCLTKDGSLLPASINASAITVGENNFVQWVVHDISEYKDNIDRIEFFHKVLKDLSEPVLVTDGTGIIRFGNDSFCRIYSLDDEIIEHTGITSLSMRGKNMEFLDAIWTELKGKNSLVKQVTLNRGQSNETIKTVFILPCYDDKGNLVNYLWLFLPSERRKEETVSASVQNL